MKPASALAAPAASAAPKRSNGLDLAISSITKQFGEGSITRMGANSRLNIETISTGNAKIDEVLGGRGLPRGRIIEIYGPESSGKTTVCLAAIAEAQRRGGNAAFIDVEHALDPKWARLLGVNIDELLISQPDCGEDALSIAEALIRSGEIDVIVIDSVAALVTKQELDGEMGDATMGTVARLMGQAMRKLTAVVSKTKCVCIFTNQIREKIGVMFGNPETTPGGKALKFFASQRIDVRRKDSIKDGDKVLGNLVKMKVVKNKISPPFTETEFEILYDHGICAQGALLDLAVEHKIIDKKGAWFAFQGELIGQGREAAREALRSNSALYAKIDEAVRAKLDENRKVVAFIPPAEPPKPVAQPVASTNPPGGFVGDDIPGET
jgi:recombination protein RecA